MKRFMVGSNLREEDLVELMMFIVRWFNFLNSMYYVEQKPNGKYNLYWNMTQSQYKHLCEDYKKKLDKEESK